MSLPLLSQQVFFGDSSHLGIADNPRPEVS